FEKHLDAFNSQMQGMREDAKIQTVAFNSQIQGMQNSFETHLQGIQAEMRNQNEAFRLQIQGMQESVNSWKGLWEASAQEIKELKGEIKELRIELEKVRIENAEFKILYIDAYGSGFETYRHYRRLGWDSCHTDRCG
ncbi:MAG: hypothetical protein FWH22_08125, partial [Fibromonadales bacterium]|nr:hypothetical protein [Fibromonadales bacterium]